MPKFIYEVKTQDGKSKREIIEASSKEDLVKRLQSQNFYILSIKEVTEQERKSIFATLLPQFRAKRSSVKLSDLTFLARNLATALSSGVTLIRALELLTSQTESAKLENILKKCSEDVRAGLSLSEAFAKYPRIFSVLWQGIVEVGEASGNLPFVLERLSEYLEMRMEFERKIKSALIYPAILVCAATLAVFVFFKFILPKFSTLFKQFNIELPLPTRIIFNISDFLQKKFFLVLAVVVAVGGGIYYYLKKPGKKSNFDRLILKAPVLGELVFLACLERYTSTMYILLDSGLPLVYSLDVAARSVGNSYLEKNILRVKEKVREGAPLSAELSKLNIFPLLISEMAKIGEETGTMPEVFKKISLHYQKDLTTRVERLIAAFEPLMVVVMGVVIGGIVISLFLPLFKLATMGG